jgi:hydrogenase nickel incorporation protein HypA/HybF
MNGYLLYNYEKKGDFVHEYSIVQSLIDLIEENAKNNDAKKVTKVEVKVGVLSGVEIELLETAFNTFKEGTICEDSEFIVYKQEVVVRCKECEKESSLQNEEYSCPHCGSYNLEVLDGEEMYLMSLELET